jgi:hypothetical protein
MEIIKVKHEQIWEGFIVPLGVRVHSDEKLYLQSVLTYGQTRPLVLMESDHHFLGENNKSQCYRLCDGYKLMQLLKQIGHRSFDCIVIPGVGTKEAAMKAHLRINLCDGDVDLLKLVEYVGELSKSHSIKQIADLLCTDEERIKLLKRMDQFDWDAFTDKAAATQQVSLF